MDYSAAVTRGAPPKTPQFGRALWESTGESFATMMHCSVCTRGQSSIPMLVGQGTAGGAKQGEERSVY
jgi:hypothetical protein